MNTVEIENDIRLMLENCYQELYDVCSSKPIPHNIATIKAGFQSAAFYLHTLMCADHSELVDIVGGILIPFKPCSIYQNHSSHLSSLQVMGSMITYCILHNVTNPLSIIGVLEDSPVFVTCAQWHNNIHFKMDVTHMVVCNIDLPHIELMSLLPTEYINDVVYIKMHSNIQNTPIHVLVKGNIFLIN